MKKIIIILSALLILLSLSIVSAEEIDANDTLESTVDVSGSSFDNIQKSIDNSKKGDVIELDGTYKINKNPITIKKSVTIQGSNKGATLNAMKKDSAIIIKAPKVTLKDLTLINSKDSCIQIHSSEKKYDLTIINCVFKSNGGSSCWDGGIIFDANPGSITIINSTIESSNADFGGAIYSVDGDLTIKNCKFTGNVATYDGGAISFGGDNLKIENSVFTNNQAKKEDGGGAISAECISMQITDSSFTKNKGVEGGALMISCNTTIRNSNFTSNSATNKGGAIYAPGVMDPDEKLLYTVNIYNSKFDSCTAGKLGNSIYADSIKLNIRDSIFKSNKYDVYIYTGELKNVNNTLKTYLLKNSIKAKLTTTKKYVARYDSYYLFKVNVKAEGKYVDNKKIKIVVYTGSKTKTLYTYFDEDMRVAICDLSKFSVGTHKVKVYLPSKYYKASPVTTKITIKKAKTLVKAPNVTAKYKKSKKFKVKIIHKDTHRKVKNLKIKIKVYTGKKVKKFIVKTNKKGIASIDTKNLKRGTHKVKISSKNRNYIVSKKSEIRIK